MPLTATGHLFFGAAAGASAGAGDAFAAGGAAAARVFVSGIFGPVQGQKHLEMSQCARGRGRSRGASCRPRRKSGFRRQG